MQAGKFPSLDSLSLNRTPLAIRGQGCDAVSPQSRRTLSLSFSLWLSVSPRSPTRIHSHSGSLTRTKIYCPIPFHPTSPPPRRPAAGDHPSFTVNAAPRTLEHVHAHKDTARKPQQARRRAFHPCTRAHTDANRRLPLPAARIRATPRPPTAREPARG